ncbi:hypothetical protein Hte_011700 [Hypoxylon texense]
MNPTDFSSRTAVAQYLAFSLITLQNGVIHSQADRKQAIKNSKRWATDFESTSRSISHGERAPPANGSSLYEPTAYVDSRRSVFDLRGKTIRLIERDRRDDQPTREESPDEFQPTTPCPTGRQPLRSDGSRSQDQRPRRSERDLARSRGGGGQTRQYCTQRCLMGLVRRAPIDTKCPNAASHQPSTPNGLHPIDHARFRRLLRRQLTKSLDDGVAGLGIGGSRGVLFQITLLAYGYTFVGKGIIQAFIPDLQHEATVYKRLKQKQGSTVPIYLGAIDLRSLGSTYYYDHRVYIR